MLATSLIIYVSPRLTNRRIRRWGSQACNGREVRREESGERPNHMSLPFLCCYRSVLAHFGRLSLTLHPLLLRGREAGNPALRANLTDPEERMWSVEGRRVTGPTLRSSFSLCFGPFITLLPRSLYSHYVPLSDRSVRRGNEKGTAITKRHNKMNQNLVFSSYYWWLPYATAVSRCPRFPRYTPPPRSPRSRCAA